MMRWFLASGAVLKRGSDEQTGSLFSYMSYEARVPAEHPLRLIRAVVDEALDVLSPEFDRLYPRSVGLASRPRSCCEPSAASVLLGPLGTAADGPRAAWRLWSEPRKKADNCALHLGHSATRATFPKPDVAPATCHRRVGPYRVAHFLVRA